MNGYLGGLIARHLTPAPMAIRPRLRSLFESSAVPGLGASSNGPGLDEVATELIAESPPVSLRREANTSPVAADADHSATPVRPARPDPRLESPPPTNPLVEAQRERDPAEGRLVGDRDHGTAFSTVQPASVASPTRAREDDRIPEHHDHRDSMQFQPPAASPERVVIERESKTSERRVELVDRSNVAAPVVASTIATSSLTGSRLVNPRIEPVVAAAPTITVTIGRVDVRAVVAATPPVQSPKGAPRPPTPSLEDYLRERAKGASR